MAKQDRERQHIVGAARRYHRLAWRQDDNRQYAPFTLPILIFSIVPGWWWAATAALLLTVAVWLDVRVGRWLEASFVSDWRTLPEALAMRRRVLARVSGMVALHALPYVVLLFAPSPAPMLSLLISIVMLMLLANMHIMTRRMIFMTAALPIVVAAIATILIVPGWTGVVLAVFTTATLLQACNLSGASVDVFNDLVEAHLDAEAARDELEQRVEERTAALREALHGAENANRAKSMFLANMSHELRTPLNAVIGYSEIIEEDLESGDVSECPQHIARVHGAGKHLLGLIGDILDVAKADAERIDLRAEPIDVSSLARSVLDTVAPMAAKNETVCDLIVEPGAAAFEADALRVKQCLLNLASNAAKFTKQGRVILRVYPHVWKDDDAIAFEFADTGIGISAETQKVLFEPFAQGDVSITKAYGGTGLGLAITRRLARLMGGDVLLQSTLGEGSRFTLVLPKQLACAHEAIDAA